MKAICVKVLVDLHDLFRTDLIIIENKKPPSYLESLVKLFHDYNFIGSVTK